MFNDKTDYKWPFSRANCRSFPEGKSGFHRKKIAKINMTQARDPSTEVGSLFQVATTTSSSVGETARREDPPGDIGRHTMWHGCLRGFLGKKNRSRPGTRWCPSSLAKLVNITSISLLFTVDISILMWFINQLVTGGPHLVCLCWDYLCRYGGFLKQVQPQFSSI